MLSIVGYAVCKRCDSKTPGVSVTDIRDMDAADRKVDEHAHKHGYTRLENGWICPACATKENPS